MARYNVQYHYWYDFVCGECEAWKKGFPGWCQCCGIGLDKQRERYCTTCKYHSN